MFGLSTQELLLITIAIVVLFGATKLPQLGDALSKGIRNFKRGMREIKEEEQQENNKEKPELTEDKET